MWCEIYEILDQSFTALTFRLLMVVNDHYGDVSLSAIEFVEWK